METKEINYSFTILGDVPSKANAYKIITINGHSSLAKSKKLRQYEKDFFLQCPCRDVYVSNFFSIDIDVYYANNRKDLDGCFKIILDCLQQCKVIKNDRECIEIHATKKVDKISPRVVIKISEIKGITVHNN